MNKTFVQQPMVLGLDGYVTLASDFIQAFQIFDLDVTPAVFIRPACCKVFAMRDTALRLTPIIWARKS